MAISQSREQRIPRFTFKKRQWFRNISRVMPPCQSNKSKWNQEVDFSIITYVFFLPNLVSKRIAVIVASKMPYTDRQVNQNKLIYNTCKSYKL